MGGLWSYICKTYANVNPAAPPLPPRRPKEFWWRKDLSVRIRTLPLAFSVRIPSQKIYIFTMLEWWPKELLLPESPVRSDGPVIGLEVGPRFTWTGALLLHGWTDLALDNKTKKTFLVSLLWLKPWQGNILQVKISNQDLQFERVSIVKLTLSLSNKTKKKGTMFCYFVLPWFQKVCVYDV